MNTTEKGSSSLCASMFLNRRFQFFLSKQLIIIRKWSISDVAETAQYTSYIASQSVKGEITIIWGRHPRWFVQQLVRMLVISWTVSVRGVEQAMRPPVLLLLLLLSAPQGGSLFSPRPEVRISSPNFIPIVLKLFLQTKITIFQFKKCWAECFKTFQFFHIFREHFFRHYWK